MMKKDLKRDHEYHNAWISLVIVYDLQYQMLLLNQEKLPQVRCSEYFRYTAIHS